MCISSKTTERTDMDQMIPFLDSLVSQYSQQTNRNAAEITRLLQQSVSQLGQSTPTSYPSSLNTCI